ncbi:hypothetical protein BD560DRAFT_391674 [Blakeslea trispora]|nr:hypothetical protein BD560DRAFT_391674 [Blakeslea trispora]
MDFLQPHLQDYLNTTEQPSLANFLEKFSHLFENHAATDAYTFRKQAIESYCKVWKSCDRKDDPLLIVHKEILDEVFYKNAKTPVVVRQAMFQWYYSLCEGHDLASFNGKYKEAINNFMSKKTTNSRALLDKMSIKLLENYDSLLPEERHVLKLSLSYVVDLIDGSDKVYKRYIKSDLFWKNLSVKKEEILDDSEDSKIEEYAKDIVEACNKDVDEALVLVLEKKVELIKKKKKNTTEYQVLMVFNYLLDNADSWLSSFKHSEAELVSRLNDLLKIFFSNTAIITKIGETTSASTKQSRNSNEFNFSKSSSSNFFISGSASTSTSKSIAGRKIDILIKSKDIELSCCEFKASASKCLTSYQRSKNLRLNQEIKEGLKKVNVNTQVIGLNWEGKYGYLFGLTEQNGVYVGYHLCNLIFPAAIKSSTIELSC